MVGWGGKAQGRLALEHLFDFGIGGTAAEGIDAAGNAIAWEGPSWESLLVWSLEGETRGRVLFTSVCPLAADERAALEAGV